MQPFLFLVPSFPKSPHLLCSSRPRRRQEPNSMASKLRRLLTPVPPRLGPIQGFKIPPAAWRSLSSSAGQPQGEEASGSAAGSPSPPPPPPPQSSETVEENGGEGGDGEVNEEGVFVNKKTGEVGGPRGPEPTRYGDWEQRGRCSDF